MATPRIIVRTFVFVNMRPSGGREKAPRARSWRIHAPEEAAAPGIVAVERPRATRAASHQPSASFYTLRMCISQTSEKAVPPTAMPITAAAKAAYEKSITAFMAALPFM
jgi:hypothetical protein